MDPYGQWTAAAQQVPDTGNTPLWAVEVLGSGHLLVRYGSLGAGLLYFGPTRLRAIETEAVAGTRAPHTRD